MDRKMKVQLDGNLESQGLARAVAAAYLAAQIFCERTATFSLMESYVPAV